MDLVVTVPLYFWADWLAEGDLPGDPPGGAFDAYDFTCGATSRPRPSIQPGERVYVVAHGRVRGYAPLVEVLAVEGKWSLVRQAGAVACTIPETVRGFQGWRTRWWAREAEVPFPRWKVEGVVLACCACRRKREIVGYIGKSSYDPLCAWCVVKALDENRAKGKPIAPGWAAEEPIARAIVERQRNVEEHDVLAAAGRR